MIYWFSGDNYNCNRTLAKKFTEFLRTEKRNWRRSVFHIDDALLLKLSANNETAELLAKFIDQQKLDVVVAIRNYHLSDTAHAWTEICVGKLTPQLSKNIQLDTAQMTAQGLFLKLVTEL